jgi:hypothetical protein
VLTSSGSLRDKGQFLLLLRKNCGTTLALEELGSSQLAHRNAGRTAQLVVSLSWVLGCVLLVGDVVCRCWLPYLCCHDMVTYQYQYDTFVVCMYLPSIQILIVCMQYHTYIHTYTTDNAILYDGHSMYTLCIVLYGTIERDACVEQKKHARRSK